MKFNYILIKHMRNQMIAIKYVCNEKTRAGITELYTWKLFGNFINQCHLNQFNLIYIIHKQTKESNKQRQEAECQVWNGLKVLAVKAFVASPSHLPLTFLRSPFFWEQNAWQQEQRAARPRTRQIAVLPGRLVPNGMLAVSVRKPFSLAFSSDFSPSC